MVERGGPETNKPELVGVIVAGRQVELSPGRAGRLAGVHCKLGQRVRKGQVIATMDTRDLRRQLAEARVVLRATRARLLRARLLAAEASERRARREKAPQVVSREALRASQFKAKLAGADVELAIIEQDRARVRVRGLMQQLAEARILAPFTGTVAATPARPGAWISQGTAVARMVGQRELWLRFAVPARHLARLRAGARLEVSVPALEVTVPATVARLAPVVDSASRMAVAEAKLDLSKEQARGVRAGLEGRARLIELTAP